MLFHREEWTKLLRMEIVANWLHFVNCNPFMPLCPESGDRGEKEKVVLYVTFTFTHYLRTPF